MKLKKIGLTISLLFMCALLNAQTSNLCQGAYYSELDGAQKLAQLQSRLYSLSDWTQHADSIKQNLRKGMELETLPKRTPLNPTFRNKKIFDGYSVEAVIFESVPGFFVTGNLYKPTGKVKKKSLNKRRKNRKSGLRHWTLHVFVYGLFFKP